MNTQRLSHERRQDVLDRVRSNGSASVSALAKLVGASPATVHRDLDYLSREGFIERVRGGAVALNDDPPVHFERGRYVLEKKAIALAAAAMAKPGVKSIFLEASTTVAHLVPHLRHLQDVVMVTNSPGIALDLSQSHSDVVIIGGNLRQRTLSTVGPQAIEALGNIAIDLAFIGISALNDEGLSSMNAIEAETKTAIIRAASRVVGMGDSRKIGKRELVPVAPLSAMDVFITDSSAAEEDLVGLRRSGLRVVVAGG